eukprot:m.113791 g.113791  ORF g.113791 m.113791 type:complete len:600 (+) comp14147_c3_seq1:278-2077(+)
MQGVFIVLGVAGILSLANSNGITCTDDFKNYDGCCSSVGLSASDYSVHSLRKARQCRNLCKDNDSCVAYSYTSAVNSCTTYFTIITSIDASSPICGLVACHNRSCEEIPSSTTSSSTVITTVTTATTTIAAATTTTIVNTTITIASEEIDDESTPNPSKNSSTVQHTSDTPTITTSNGIENNQQQQTTSRFPTTSLTQDDENSYTEMEPTETGLQSATTSQSQNTNLNNSKIEPADSKENKSSVASISIASIAIMGVLIVVWLVLVAYLKRRKAKANAAASETKSEAGKVSNWTMNGAYKPDVYINVKDKKPDETYGGDCGLDYGEAKPQQNAQLNTTVTETTSVNVTNVSQDSAPPPLPPPRPLPALPDNKMQRNITAWEREDDTVGQDSIPDYYEEAKNKTSEAITYARTSDPMPDYYDESSMNKPHVEPIEYERTSEATPEYYDEASMNKSQIEHVSYERTSETTPDYYDEASMKKTQAEQVKYVASTDIYKEPTQRDDGDIYKVPEKLKTKDIYARAKAPSNEMDEGEEEYHEVPEEPVPKNEQSYDIGQDASYDIGVDTGPTGKDSYAHIDMDGFYDNIGGSVASSDVASCLSA